LPDLLVNLNSTGRKTSFLKISISLDLEEQADTARIQAVMPRIIDNFQVYLRELRVEDLRGSGGIYRLREELLARVNAAASPAKVADVLFKEMLVQERASGEEDGRAEKQERRREARQGMGGDGG